MYLARTTFVLAKISLSSLDDIKTAPYSLNVPRQPKQLTFTDHRMRTGRGGPRPGAGRPRGPRPRVLHRARGAVPVSCPVHVTLRVRPGVPSLRGGALVHEWRRSLAEASERGSFRVTHYSLQGDHAHLIVEAHGKEALACGMKSIGARLARAVNRVGQRSGPVLDGRYHHRSLRSPREVRRALAYVLLQSVSDLPSPDPVCTPPKLPVHTVDNS